MFGWAANAAPTWTSWAKHMPHFVSGSSSTVAIHSERATCGRDSPEKSSCSVVPHVNPGQPTSTGLLGGQRITLLPYKCNNSVFDSEIGCEDHSVGTSRVIRHDANDACYFLATTNRVEVVGGQASARGLPGTWVQGFRAPPRGLSGPRPCSACSET